MRAEIRKVIGDWLALGVSGFRVGAAPFLFKRKGRRGAHPDTPHAFLVELRGQEPPAAEPRRAAGPGEHRAGVGAADVGGVGGGLQREPSLAGADPHRGPASLVDRIHFTGYTLFTLGNGDFSPQGHA